LYSREPLWEVGRFPAAFALLRRLFSVQIQSVS